MLTNANNKNTISFILKIFNNYFNAVFYIKVPNIYRISSIIKHIGFPFNLI